MSIPALAVFDALFRKLRQSYRQAGLLRTLMRCYTTPLKAVSDSIRDLLPTERRFRANEFHFDRSHNVNTRGRGDPGWKGRISSPNWMHGTGYAPVPAADLTRIIAGLDINYQNFVFIDMGAGKGRALFVAAQFPFKRVLGIEYSPALAEVLKKNIASYRSSEQRCFELTACLQDATEFELPHDPLVLFFHHPFEEVIFQQVRSRIEQSLEQHAREILVVYYDPRCGAIFEERPHFRVLQRGTPITRSAGSGDWVVYEACSVSMGGC